MPEMSINFWAVLVASVVNMVIGGLWYSVSLFGKKWLRLVGKTEEDMKQGGAGTAYVGMTIASVVMAYVLAHFVDFAQADSLTEGMETGFWAWLGFVATTHAGNHLFEGRSWLLFGINAGYYLVSLPVMGAILAVWV